MIKTAPTPARDAIALAQTEAERAAAPLRRIGPWPISYVRSDGETVYRVGYGHDIGERSLRAFGFFTAEEAETLCGRGLDAAITLDRRTFVAAQRSAGIRGKYQATTRLRDIDAETREAIRAAYAKGTTHQTLYAKYNLSRKTLRLILRSDARRAE